MRRSSSGHDSAACPCSRSFPDINNSAKFGDFRTGVSRLRHLEDRFIGNPVTRRTRGRGQERRRVGNPRDTAKARSSATNAVNLVNTAFRGFRLGGEPAEKRIMGEPAEKRREGRLLSSRGQVVVVCKDDHYRANDEASHAREQLQRTFGLAMGSGAVLVPQVEAYGKIDGRRLWRSC